LKRFLITTAEEKLWQFDGPVIFLGEWCKKYSREIVWGNINGTVAQSYGVSLKEKNQDFQLVRKLETELLPKLTNALNSIHGTSYSLDFWCTLVGHWLRSYLKIIVNRVHTLESVLRETHISGANFSELIEEEMAPIDLRDFHYNSLRSNNFNSMLDFKILSSFKEIDFPLNQVSISSRNLKIGSAESTSNQVHQKTKISNMLKKGSNFFCRDNEPFISTTYLPRNTEIKFQLSYLQTPKFWEDDLSYSCSSKFSQHYRDQLSHKWSVKNSLEHKYLNLLPYMLPISYLEGFEEMLSQVNQTNWPKNPKFIFTSNLFAYSELFKFYSALKKEDGVTYFLGQHGSQYGTQMLPETDIEHKVSSKFLTWGWASSRTNDIPAFCLKIAGRKKKNSQSGYLLLVQAPLGERIETWDTNKVYELYFSDQLTFIGSIALDLSKDLLIRLHSDPSKDFFETERRLKDYQTELNIESGIVNIWQLIEQSRLVVFTYDSTGFLECLALNIPTLAFWQSDMQHLNEESKGFYQILVDAGIIYFHPETIANKVNEIWSDVETWWQSPVVQIAREKFSSQYARTSKKPIRDLRRIIRENLTN